jgi:hypothetical protein
LLLEPELKNAKTKVREVFKKDKYKNMKMKQIMNE